jgi:5-formyltetrahydrofolate cyclo-ligase
VTPDTDRRNRLRRELRRQRRALTAADRTAAEASLKRRLRSIPAFRAARAIAIFNAFDGEPDLGDLIGEYPTKRFYVPILRGPSMRFARMTTTTLCRINFFGIREPKQPKFIDHRRLDLVLTPLVGFDPVGVRLGVGRGYYDRAFSFLRHRQIWQRPKLLGVAFSIQQIPPLEAAAWDVPLWGAVTETATHYFRPGHR